MHHANQQFSPDVQGVGGGEPSAGTSPSGVSRSVSGGMLAVVAALALLATTALASFSPVGSTTQTPPSARGITPTLITGFQGFVSCDFIDPGAFAITAENVQAPDGTNSTTATLLDSDGTPKGQVTVTVNGDKSVGFVADIPIQVVNVKGGTDANSYDYRSTYPDGVTSDSGLFAPLNAGGQVADLSNITFCTNPVVEDPATWCSPGYWRQPQHLGSWVATGFSTSTRWSETTLHPGLIPAKAPIKDPTLLMVLQSPQTYGGTAFNAVGDLLSGAHPEVNFTGERVEDSCPLS